MTTTIQHAFAFLFSRAALAILAILAFPTFFLTMELVLPVGPFGFYMAGFIAADGFVAQLFNGAALFCLVICNLSAFAFAGVQCWNLVEDWQCYLESRRYLEYTEAYGGEFDGRS